ncbi:MAG: D-glycero-alpha-D-manno-heptose-1,7-bisphosphate 7-phosphatase [Bacteroidota bacterium]
MEKAFFLDRDGVLNKEIGNYAWHEKDFELLPFIFDWLKILQEQKYLLIVISNQGGIGRGRYTKKDVDHVHTLMKQRLEENNIHLTDIYYCPHHPTSSNCLCRKPGHLLLEKAIARYHIKPEKSFFIGDSDRDIIAAKHAGVSPIKIQSNEDPTQQIKKILHV